MCYTLSTISPVVGLAQLLRYWRQYKTAEQEAIVSSYRTGPLSFGAILLFSLFYCVLLFSVGTAFVDLFYLGLLDLV